MTLVHYVGFKIIPRRHNSRRDFCIDVAGLARALLERRVNVHPVFDSLARDFEVSIRHFL